MHTLIRSLVHAETPEAALETAKHDVFIPLVDRGPFDYYVTFDADGRGIAGKDRWGDYPVVARTDSAEGRTLVADGWQSTVNAYEDSFDRVEELLATYDRSAFWEDEDIHRQYRDAFHAISEFDGSHTYLYDEAVVKILHERVAQAFHQDAVADEVIDRIAATIAAENGDCREALTLLLRVGRQAEQENADVLTPSHLEKVLSL